MEYSRKYYLDKLITKKHNNFIKVITGLRRSGKSYLLFTLFKRHLLASGILEEQIIEMSFDEFENRDFRNPEIFYPYVKEQIKPEKNYYILLDEVQLLGEFEAVLNGLLRLPNVDIYVTGSNAKFLAKDIITEFRGRGTQVHINPLSFIEFMEHYDGDKYAGLAEYMKYGGLPIIAQKDNEIEKVEILKSLLAETYIKDITSRNNIRNDGELSELLDLLASSIGSLTNPQKLANTFKSEKGVNISLNTIKNYIDYLEDAYLISGANRYDIKGKKYINTPLKYYYTDIGLRNARLNFRQYEETHLMENIIYNELITRGYNVDVGVVSINEKNDNGNYVKKQLEIDFICNLGAKRYYIQSAYALPDLEKQQQEIRPFNNLYDSFKKIVIRNDISFSWVNEEGILMLNLFDFLLNPDSLDL